MSGFHAADAGHIIQSGTPKVWLWACTRARYLSAESMCVEFVVEGIGTLALITRLLRQRHNDGTVVLSDKC